MTIAYQQHNALADRLAREPMSPASLEHRVLRHLWVIDDDTGARARANRERAIEWVLAIFEAAGTRPSPAATDRHQVDGDIEAMAGHRGFEPLLCRPPAARCSARSRTPRPSSERST